MMRPAIFRQLTQAVECHPHTGKVIGLNPLPPTMIKKRPGREQTTRSFFYKEEQMKFSFLRLGFILSFVVLPWGGISGPQTVLAAGDYSVSVEGNKVERLGLGENYYHGSGQMEITISPGIDSQYTRSVVSAQGSCIGTPNPCGGQATLIFSIDASGVATSRVDMDAMPADAVLSGHYWYRLTGLIYVNNTSDGTKLSEIPINYELHLYKNPQVALNAPDERFPYISVYQAYWDNGIVKARPLVGEPVTLESDTFQFEPAVNTTDEDGRAYFFVSPTSGALRRMASDRLTALGDKPDYSGQVSVDVSGKSSETFTHTMAFARISCLRGMVLKVDGLGNVTPAKDQDVLHAGDVVRLMGPESDPQGNDRYPMVCIDFNDGRRYIAESEFAKEGSWINIEIGETGVSGVLEKSWKIDLKNLAWDIKDNHREYLKVAVYKVYAGAIVGPLGWGWKAATVTKKLIEVGFKHFFGGKKSSQQARSPAGYEELGPLMSFSREGNRLRQSTGYTLPSIGVTFMGDGSFEVVNWERTVELTAREETSGSLLAATVLPTGTYSGADGEYTAFAPVGPIPTHSLPGAITISPVAGSLLTAPPLIQVKYPWNTADPVLQDTLDVRLNGVSITPYLTRTFATDGSPSWQAPYSWPFPTGVNEIDAFIMTRSGTTYVGKSTFTMDLTPQPPQHLKAYRGPTKTILRWQAGPQTGLAGFLVYRAASADGAPVQVTPDPITEPVYITDQPGWYSVAAIGLNGKTSATAGPVLGDLDSAATGTAPAAPAGLALTAGEQAVTIAFQPDSFTPFYRLERAAGETGPFQALARLTGSPYIDKTVAIGNTYWYRLVALGIDQTSSPPAGPLAAVIADQAPQTPKGFNSRFESQGLRLLWDPSPEPDLAGYNLYRAQPDGAFVKLNASPLTGAAFVDVVPVNSVYAWHLTAVDAQGHESQPTTDLEASTWIHPLFGLNSTVFLPVVLR
jgi:hypothetical protein